MEDDWRLTDCSLNYISWVNVINQQTVTIKLLNNRWFLIIANKDGVISTKKSYQEKFSAQQTAHKFMQNK